MSVSEASYVIIMSCADFLTLSSAFLSVIVQLLNHTKMSWVMTLSTLHLSNIYRTFIKRQQQFLGRIHFSQWPQKVQLLLCFFHKGSSVGSPCKVLKDVCSQESEVTDPLYNDPFDIKRGRFLPLPPKVYHQLLCFGGVECQIVVRTPSSKFLDFIPVWRPVIVMYQFPYSSVVHKLNNDVAVEVRCTVMGVWR